MPNQATKSALEPLADTPEPQPLTEEIATLAYVLWEQRGCPFGSPEEDWLKAEEQLKAELAAQT